MSLDQQLDIDGIILTEAAATKVKDLVSQQPDESLFLRISVAPGGCSGLRYQLSLDERELDGDVTKEWFGVPVVTDRMSAPYLIGATIDFVDTHRGRRASPSTTRTRRAPAPAATASTEPPRCGRDYG